jgi:DNA polymerase III delta prime subunit
MNKTYREYLEDFKNTLKIKSRHNYYNCEEAPEKIAFFGKCCFFVPAHLAYDIKGYKSKVFINPSYNDIFNLCDEITEETGDENNNIFKDISIFSKDKDDIYIFEIIEPIRSRCILFRTSLPTKEQIFESIIKYDN